MKIQQPSGLEDHRAKEYFNELFRDLSGQFVELRAFPSRGKPIQSFHGDTGSLIQECESFLEMDDVPELFFGVCPRRKQSGKKDAVAAVPCLWVDLDAKNFPDGKGAMLSRLRTFPSSPTAIIDSGNGVHAYWFFREAEKIASQGDVSRIELALRALAVAIEGDMAVAELARIMRVPGTLNLKDRESPRPVRILEFHPDRRYNFVDFNLWVDTEAQKPGVRPSWESIAQLLGELENGNRNSSFARVIGRFHHDGHDPETIFAILRPHADRVAFDPDELRREIEGIVTRYPRKPIRRKRADQLATNRKPMIVRLDDVEPEDVRWLWRPYIPFAKLSFLDGDPGLGKSTLAIQLAACVTNGFGFPDMTGEPTGTCDPGNVLFLVREDGLGDTLRPRAECAGANLTRIFAVDGWTDPDSAEQNRGPITLQDLGILRKALEETQPRLVVIDPIQSFLGAGVDLHRANETRPILDRIAELAREFRCAILCIRHLTKASHSRAIYRALGSIDLSAAARSILIVGEDNDDPQRRIMAHAKSNLAEHGVSQSFSLSGGEFHWTGPSSLSAEEVLSTPVINEDCSAMQEAIDFLINTVSSGPQPAETILEAARKAGISLATLRRAKKLAGVQSTHSAKSGGTRGEGQWMWARDPELSIPDEKRDNLEGEA